MINHPGRHVLLRLHDETLIGFSPLLASAPQCPLDTEQWLTTGLNNYHRVTDTVGVCSGEQCAMYKALSAN